MKKVDKFMYPWSEQTRIVKSILRECFKRDLSKINRNSAVFGFVFSAIYCLPSLFLLASGFSGAVVSIFSIFSLIFTIPIIVLSHNLLFFGIKRNELELGINQVLYDRKYPFRLNLSRGWFYHYL